MTRRLALALAAATTLSLGLTGCAAATAPSAGTSSGITVLASFYPLEYVAQQVGGDAVNVSSLTPVGAEPHDLELSPKQVRSLSDADLVVYLGGFQPAVDKAITASTPAHVYDAATVADLIPATSASPTAGSAEAGAPGSLDPHFWLDPVRLARVAEGVGTELAAIDPAHAADYRQRAATLVADLTALDQDFTRGLATCDRRVIVTAHAAFAYLAQRYNLEQVGIAGVEPDAQPSGARLREVSDVVRQYGVTTIFFETLVSPKVAETLASDLGVTAVVLDPVEGLADPTTDYLGIMHQNLETLRTALGCG